jgi:hypothetical protein
MLIQLRILAVRRILLPFHNHLLLLLQVSNNTNNLSNNTNNRNKNSSSNKEIDNVPLPRPIHNHNSLIFLPLI